MKESTNIENLDFNYQLFKGMLRGNLNYIYRGVFNSEMTDHVIDLAETNIMDANETATVRKKVYNIIVESLQNIAKHQAEDAESLLTSTAIFAVQRKNNNYYITTGNQINADTVIGLKSRLDMINSLSKDELRDFYKARLTSGEISSKGGAGLGLIDMARKSGSKLLYDFKILNDVHALFYLHSKIPVMSEINNSETDDDSSLKQVSALHQTLNSRNILLIINSFFTQQSMLQLLRVIESQINETLQLRKQLYSVMVEVVQNIIKHGADYESTDMGKPGMFYIAINKSHFLLNSGNYILNTEIDELAANINYTNSLSIKDLEDYYEQKLLNFENETSKGAGLGFIDLRLKTGNLIRYNLKKVNDNVSFLSLETTIDRT
ncbi:MAG TPA: hypothetical protein DCQ31_07320 [Bacteroidales bacterium]|nr:hypothetical protein [Bacteroidales bacterium]